ncbi:ABC transporter permease [Pseudonocardiaceae bacterium YIM PH 21723]|nr:ABC transporter permease [Pseudonocardiaceae bacterium YIM PH 21723]
MSTPTEVNVLNKARRRPLFADTQPAPWVRGVSWAVLVITALAITSYVTELPQLTSSGTMQSAIRLALPIMLAGLGGLWAERAGVVNIGLEGMMILGTWGAAWAGYQWGPWAGVIAGAAFGALGGLLHALATVTFGVNHIVSGVAINLLGAGVTKYLSTLIFEPVSRNPRESPTVPKFDTYSSQPFGRWLGELEETQRFGISDVAGVLRGMITGLSPLTMLSILLVPLSFYLLWRTAFGLRLRSCGENPRAADSLGVQVNRYKYIAVIISGALAGLGGAALVVNPGQTGYLEGQTGGRGFIGLAAMIFGNWRPGGMLTGSLLFGYTDALQLRQGPSTVHALLYAALLVLVVLAIYEALRLRWMFAALCMGGAAVFLLLYALTDELPEQLTPYTPHLVTLVVLALSSQRLRPPAASGQNYRSDA